VRYGGPQQRVLRPCRAAKAETQRGSRLLFLLVFAGRRGESVLDPCGGNGTTAVAANERDMRSILIERENIERRVHGAGGATRGGIE
jgi:hypothetical protein